MVTADEPSPRWEFGDVTEVRASALDVVSDALEWRLADARWLAIEQILGAMAVALQDSDLETLAVATADLELAGPLRITRIGTIPVVPPPPPVRDRLNQLVHSLGGVRATQHEPDDTGSDSGGTSLS
jgi:hypothetical protein